MRLISRVRDMKNQNKLTKQNKKSNHIHQEKLRQARAMFKLRFNLLKLSIIASFASILLIYFGDVSVEKVKLGQEIIYRIVLVTFRVTKDADDGLNEDKNASN